LNIFDIDSASFDLNFQSVVKFIHPEDIDHLKNINKKYLQDHQPVAYECRIVTAKGLTKTIFVHSKVVLNTHGEVTGTVGIVQDITERKQNEERLAGERELFRLVIENIPDQIYLKDTESRFMLCNMPVATNAGRASQAEMIGKTDFDFLPAEIAKQCFAEEQHIIQSGIPLINHEEHMHDKITGKSRWSLSTKFPLRNNSGDMIGLIGINHDITKRKIAERELEEANRELTILFNSIDEIFFSVDMVTFKVIQISDTCEKLYGYTQAEFFSNYELWFQIIHPEDKYIIENENEMMRRGELISNQYRIIRKDNNIRWVETKITPTLNKEGKLIRVDGLTRDITDRKNAEAELNNSEERYRKIVETSQEGIWMVDENNKTVFVNKKMCEMFEYSQEHMMGKEIFYFMEDDWKQKGSDAMSLIVAGKGGKMEFRFITKSGLYLWTNLSVNAVFNDAGIYKGALAMVTDITKRKNDEELLQKSQLTLEKKNLELEQKNKELEQFAYVASHDLQEPLRTITSFVQIFKQQYSGKLDSKSDKYLKYIVQASDRMRVLIKDLLDFSRIGHNKDIEQVDSAQILHDVMADINKIIQDSHADISAEHLPVINGYTTELKQLFKNLVLNAIKFRKQNVPLKINITARRKNDHWQFAVTDNGIGIDEQHYDRIFVIFQRLHTRSEYQGSGIGLSHCKKIVELHHGKIWVQSTPGEGSTFYFTIHSPKQKINEAEIKMHNAN
ncbi:MAG: PAS domain S-box protein, partial [Ginsengibacter sp.]